MIRVLFKSVYILSILLIITGCAGGGSEGTGGTIRSVQGTVSLPNGAPVADAQITILSTGDTSTTNSEGMFSLQTTDLSPILEIEVQKDSSTLQASISSISDESQSVNVTIKFDPSKNAIKVDHLDVEVKVVGLCDPYFENNRVIRQANAVPSGQRCTIKVVTRSNGKLVGNVSYGLRYGNCSGTGGMTLLGAGLTSVAFNPGVGQINFPYIDDAEHCIYEVVVPFGNTDGQLPIIYQIVTFTKQKK